MAGKTYSLSPFLGINTQRSAAHLAVRQGDDVVGHFLADAVNIDVTDAGTALPREGMQPVLAGDGWHSLQALHDGTAVAVHGSEVCLLSEVAGGLQSTILRQGVSGLPMSYARVPDALVMSDGQELLCLKEGVLASLTMPVPEAPQISFIGEGSLPAGQYQVAMTFVAQDGKESGLSSRTVVMLPHGSILIVSPPVSWPEGATKAALYVSDANGDMLFFAGYVSSSIVHIPMPTDSASTPPTLGQLPMPPGKIVRYGGGRLISATGNFLTLSQPYALSLHDPVNDFLAFPEAITLIAVVDGGFYICADKTYFVQDALEAMRVVLPFGGVAGSDVALPDGSAAWYSERGLVLADAKGGVTTPMAEKVTVSPAHKAVAMFRQSRGMEQIVVAAVTKS